MALVAPAHGFIFIKTTKTAGTSIEIDLSPHLGPDAIVTPILPAVAGHMPRNHSRDGDALYFFNHMTASTLRHRLGAETFDGMFKFCVEREPVSKCISHFHMLRNSALHGGGDSSDLTWEAYLEKGDFPHDHNRYSAVRQGKRFLLVDRVLRYDHLPAALETLMAERGLSEFRLTSLAKAEYSRNRIVSPEDVTPKQRQRIHDAFAEALEVTGIDWHAP